MERLEILMSVLLATRNIGWKSRGKRAESHGIVSHLNEGGSGQKVFSLSSGGVDVQWVVGGERKDYSWDWGQPLCVSTCCHCKPGKCPQCPAAILIKGVDGKEFPPACPVWWACLSFF